MKRDYIDFHEVAPRHAEIHKQLINWARSQNGPRGGRVTPMFRMYRSKQDNDAPLPAPSMPVDHKQAGKINDEVQKLSERHRKALQWHYVLERSPRFGVKYVQCTERELITLVVDGRQLLAVKLRIF